MKMTLCTCGLLDHPQVTKIQFPTDLQQESYGEEREKFLHCSMGSWQMMHKLAEKSTLLGVGELEGNKVQIQWLPVL